MSDIITSRTLVLATSLFSSKTFWINFLTLVAAIGSATEITSFVIPPKYLPLCMAVVAAINIFLRMITTQPVSATIMPGSVTLKAIDQVVSG